MQNQTIVEKTKRDPKTNPIPVVVQFTHSTLTIESLNELDKAFEWQYVRQRKDRETRSIIKPGHHVFEIRLRDFTAWSDFSAMIHFLTKEAPEFWVVRQTEPDDLN